MPLGVSPLDTAQREGRLWTPLQLRASGGALFTFVEAYDISSISCSSSTTLSEIRDKSGRGKHFTKIGSNDLPWTNRNTMGPFGNSNHAGIATGPPEDIWPDRQTGLIVAIMTYTSGVVAMKYENNGAGSRVGFEGTNRVDWPNDGAAQLASWSETLSATEFKILSVRRTTAGKTVRLNGRQVASDTNTDTLSVGSTSIFMIGADVPSGGNQSDCSYKAFLVTAQSDPLTEQRVEGYFAWQTGIPLAASHPFCNAPPTVGA